MTMMKLLAASLVLMISTTMNAIGANERICSDQTPNQQQEKAVQSYSSNSASIKEMKRFSSSVSDYMNVTIADINNDGKEEIFYSLRGGTCGDDVGVLMDLENGKWREILKENCYSGCWILLDSYNGGYRNILQQNMSNAKGRSRCVYNISKGKYKCN